ncbi:winged helix domain-containing protein [Mesorhizobium marinum]|uniref:winged helix domain-containing protein n=1 Tax=Mesorhizobium marinum TaxID=3228790 RepID=UPI003467911A
MLIHLKNQASQDLKEGPTMSIVDPVAKSANSNSRNRERVAGGVAKKFAIVVRIKPDGRIIRLDGRAAWVLNELVKVGKRSLTASDYPAGISLAHYILLCRKEGFLITTEREAHAGVFSGVHARYRLETPVTVLETPKAAA